MGPLQPHTHRARRPGYTNPRRAMRPNFFNTHALEGGGKRPPHVLNSTCTHTILHLDPRTQPPWGLPLRDPLVCPPLVDRIFALQPVTGFARAELALRTALCAPQWGRPCPLFSLLHAALSYGSSTACFCTSTAAGRACVAGPALGAPWQLARDAARQHALRMRQHCSACCMCLWCYASGGPAAARLNRGAPLH